MVPLYLVLVCCLSRYISPASSAELDSPTGDAGKPLFLTPYIEAGKVEEGRRAAFVNMSAWSADGIQSFAGFLTVNKTFNSNLFFWYFPAEKKPEVSPVVVWLQGGPGSSSLLGLFEEHGAFCIGSNRTLKTRQYRWSRFSNIIYIDNPVGTGFSFTDSDRGYATDQTSVGNELFSALTQFLKLFPELKDNKLFITGESYGGKYVPALAYTIHSNNRKNNSRINLNGIAIGNGLIDPETMLKYGDHLLQLGLIDDNMWKKYNNIESEIIENIRKNNFKLASEGFDNLILSSNKSSPTLFFNTTGFSNYYNFLHTKDGSAEDNIQNFLKNPTVRAAIHVGNLSFDISNYKVMHFLYEDMTKSVKPWFIELLEEYKVLLYSGQLDLIIPYTSTLRFLRSMDWSGRSLYEVAERKQMMVNDELGGYYKTVKNLTEVLIRNAGHLVPSDQPKWAAFLMSRFVLAA